MLRDNYRRQRVLDFLKLPTTWFLVAGPPLLVSGWIFQLPLLSAVGGLIMLVVLPSVGSLIPPYHLMNLILTIHIRIHGSRMDLYKIDPAHENSPPSFKEVALNLFTGNLGIASILISGGAILPISIIDIQSEESVLIYLYLISSLVPVLIYYPIWLLETTGATCKEPRLGQVNIGRLVSLVLSSTIGIGAILHYARTFYDFWALGSNVQSTLIILPILAAGSALFMAHFMTKAAFRINEEIWYAKSNARYFIEDKPKFQERKRQRRTTG